jgi:hypothetical protein
MSNINYEDIDEDPDLETGRRMPPSRRGSAKSHVTELMSIKNPSRRNSKAVSLKESLEGTEFSKKSKTPTVTSSSGGKTEEKKIEWSQENELIMVEWCDNALCYKWMNTQSNLSYSYLNAWFTIPAITLSTISGTASFAQNSIPASFRGLAPVVIGTINILVGILTTIQQYLKISELNEAHRVSAIAWDKFARNIRIELSKAPDERMDAGQFLKLNRQEYDRLMETSPPINESIIAKFQNKFAGKKDSVERLRYEELKKPDICNIIVSANNYRHPWYKEMELMSMVDIESVSGSDEGLNFINDQIAQKKEEFKADLIKEAMIKETIMKQQLYEQQSKKEEEIKQAILKQQEELQQAFREQFTKEQMEREKVLMEKMVREQLVKEAMIKEQLEKEKLEFVKEKEQEFMQKQVQHKKKEERRSIFQKNAMDALRSFRVHKQMIEDYMKTFETNYGRKPLKDEIIDNFSGKEGVNKEVMMLYIDKYEDQLL